MVRYAPAGTEIPKTRTGEGGTSISADDRWNPELGNPLQETSGGVLRFHSSGLERLNVFGKIVHDDQPAFCSVLVEIEAE